MLDEYGNEAANNEINEPIKNTIEANLDRAEDVYDNIPAVGKVGFNIATGAIPLLAKGLRKGLQVADSKLYRPISSECINSPDFVMPRMLLLADGSERKRIRSCKNAEGRLVSIKNSDMLYLYDDSSTVRSLEFYPHPDNNVIYYADPYEHNRFINVDQLSAYFQRQKLAELLDIGSWLGAKRLLVEILDIEKTVKNTHARHHAAADIKIVSAENLAACDKKENTNITIRSTIGRECTANKYSAKPKLKWFKRDPVLSSIIKNTGDKIVCDLEGSSYVGISKEYVGNIKLAIKKIGASNSLNFDSNIIKDYTSKIHIEFYF